MNVRMKSLTWYCIMVLLLLFAGPSFAGDTTETPPDSLDLKKVKFTIVDTLFVSELSGIRKRFKEPKTDKYRGLVLTVKVQKPAGQAVRLIAQDFSLHYRYGSKSDVARCNGISTFSKSQDVDRPMKLIVNVGSMTTGSSTTKATTFYTDLFFQNMEPDTRDLHLFLAQPIGASFTTKGWK